MGTATATATTTTEHGSVITTDALWFDLMDDSDAAQARMSKNGDAGCTACGRRVNPDTCWWVHATQYGELFAAGDPNADRDPVSQGCFAIGSECAKRVPVAFRERW